MSRRPAEEAANGQSDPKRAKIDPPKPSFDIASIRAQIAAKKAALEAAANTNGSASPASAASPAPTPRPAAAANSGPAGPAALPPTPKMDQSVAERLAAAKARIEAMSARSSNPYLSGSGSMPKPATSTATSTAPKAAPSSSTNSSIALHPLLMGGQQSTVKEEKNEKRKERDRYKTMAPKFSTVKANAAEGGAGAAAAAAASAPSLNPYAASSSTAAVTPGERIFVRKTKQFQFSQPGRYVRQGDALRNEEKMEALRQRIAEASRKAGLDSEFDTLERSLKRQPPPEVEWWDKALLPEGNTYDNIESAVEWMTTSDDSLITHLIQHPIPIAAPSDRKQGERGLMLTKKEQKKMRRQRRKAELEDKQDRQKMGLIPPDPPKVRLANLMKVLTSDAVQDPTKVEAKVRREVAQRANKHEMDNQERKLTTEQRKQKEYEQLVARERKGIYAAAFKIKYLTNGRHRFKVRETAKKDQLSGVCIFHPSFALVLVEGTDKGIKHYRQLMEHRIDWTEEARPLGEDGEGEDDDDDEARPATATKTQQDPDSLADNKCELIWSGEVPDRAFKQFRARHAESDTGAKGWLTTRYEGYWDLAKRWVWAGEDL